MNLPSIWTLSPYLYSASELRIVVASSKRPDFRPYLLSSLRYALKTPICLSKVTLAISNLTLSFLSVAKNPFTILGILSAV